jgi:hypothetical protein
MAVKVPDWLKSVVKTLGDFFLDKNGDGDDKRFWGAVLMVVAIIYLFTRPAGPDAWAVCGGLITFATGLLWKASTADTKSPPAAPPSNPTQGLSG